MSTLNALQSNTLLAAAAALLLAAAVPAQADRASPSSTLQQTRQFDIARQPLEAALRQFAHQSGLQVMFAPEVVKGLEAPAVQGQHSSAGALRRLLEGSALEFTVNGTTVAVREAARSKNGVNDRPADQMRVADNKTTPARPSLSSDPEGSADQDEEMVVKDTRLGRQVEGVVPRGENEAIYFEVIDREEIEKYGVTDMDELLRRIPQVSNYGTGEQRAVTDIRIGAGGPGLNLSLSTVSLRGSGSTRTAVLVNGRRITRSSASGGIDISRIPLASVERIEILPAAASALYGGGAVGGAINIITRSDYRGRDLTLNVGTTTEGGGTNSQATYVGRWSLRGGRTSGTTIVNVSRQEELRAHQRDFMQRALDRIRPDIGLVDAAGRSVYEAVMIPTFRGMPGTFVLNSVTGGLGIPGNPNARYASVPVGHDGSALTPASFSATAGAANLGLRVGRSLLIRPSERASISLTLEHKFMQDKLSLYVDAMVDAGRYWASYPSAVSSVTMSPTDIRNPFRTNLATGFVGRPVILYYDPVEVPDSYAEDEKISGRLVAGLRGKLPRDWTWAWDVSGDIVKSRLYSSNSYSLIGALIHTQDPARWGIYNPLRDHNAYPMSQSDTERYFSTTQTLYSPKSTGATNLQLSGPALKLPAGDLRTSVGGELLWWVNQFPGAESTVGSEYARIMNYPETTRDPEGLDILRRLTRSVQGEVRVPIFGQRWHPIPGMHTLELVGSTRHEVVIPKRSQLSNGDIGPKKATTSAIALKFAPVRDVAVRVGFSEGFVQQDDLWLNEDPNPTPINLNELVADPLRGGVLTSTPVPTIFTGNSRLDPETSEARVYGLILTPVAMPGLTMTVDYTLSTRIGGVRQPSLQHMLDYPDLYVGRIQRDEPSEDDLLRGWAGPIRLADRRYVNTGKTQTESVDTQVRYQFDVSEVGNFTLSVNAGWTNFNRSQATVGQPFLNSADTSPRWRGRGYVAWTKGPLTMNVNARYTGHYSTETTYPTESLPRTIPYDGEHIGSSLLWDFQLTYDIPAWGGASKYLGGVLSATQWRISVQNLLNREPPFRTDFNGSFYSRYDDVRQRTVNLQLRKAF